MTSRFLPNTYVDVYRDNSGLAASGTFEGYDDPQPEDALLVARRPAYLIATTKRSYDRVSGRTTVVEIWTGRMRPGEDVREFDRVRDQRTGDWFTVDSVISPPLVVGAADVRLSLTRVPR